MRSLFTSLLLLIANLLSAQVVTLTGTVIDASTNESLVNAYVLADSASTVVDLDGSFSIAVLSLPAELTISFLGYETTVYTASSAEVISIALKQERSVLDIMTVTASKYEKRLSESTVSIEVLQPQLINSVNTVDVDAALDKIPGVQMIDGQANIRGGSGYSYGAGSRVMLLIDDMPALQVDAGFPNWGDVPVENIAQIEVLKGAASALYGSSALNGIINIRTGTPTSVPQTKVSAAYTTYGDARNPEAQWWGDSTRYQYNMSFVHKQKFGRLDVVAGGFYTRLESFNQFTFQKRRRGNLKLQYQLADKAFVRVNTVMNKGDNGDFFIWDNDSTGLYQPFGGNPATSDNFRYIIDPSLHIEDSYGNSHKVLTRFHHVSNNNNMDQGNESNTVYGEYQFQREFAAHDLILTSGAVLQNSNTDAELFGDTTFSARNTAAYLQLDKVFLEKFNVSGGLRYEHNRQLTPESFNGIEVPGGEISEGELIARAGLSYEYAPYSAIRASWGQGYRLPTITEKFITTSFAGFNIRPNPTLGSERGWTAELGVRQAFGIGATKGYVDLSLFTSRYQDMAEFTADLSDLLNIGFQSQNVGDTEINGIDLGIFTSMALGEAQLNLYGGYTYLDPKYLDFGTDSLLLEGLSTDQNFLKYRTAHNAKMDFELQWKSFTFGGALAYASHIINIDKPLERIEIELNSGAVLVTDIVKIGKFREEHPNGFTRLDLRTSYTFRQAKLTFLVNNLFNSEYTLRPGLMEAPRNYAMRLDYTLDWK